MHSKDAWDIQVELNAGRRKICIYYLEFVCQKNV